MYGEMTVEECLKFAAELKRSGKGKSSADRKGDQARAAGGRQEASDQQPFQGYKQRVGLAQAVLGDPETIILDEPTVGLDPGQMIEMRELIRSLKKDHTLF
ncbi:MAG: hypothetical protein ACLURV_11545 [Gallintestinimicrobium sp.]